MGSQSNRRRPAPTVVPSSIDGSIVAMLRFSNVVALLALGFALAAVRAGATDVPAEALWVALKSGGHIALMRHAEAPGTGDPANFRLDDCSTQRNLSAAGRQQAERIGQAIREQGIMIGRVWSSRWCRCRETAQRLGSAPVEPLPILDSFFRDRERGSQSDGGPCIASSFVSRTTHGSFADPGNPPGQYHRAHRYPSTTRRHRGHSPYGQW